MLQRASPPLRLADPGLLPLQAFIDGAWSAGAHGRFGVDNPADGARIGDEANCGAVDVARAIEAAQRAFAGRPWNFPNAKYGIDEYVEIKYLCTGGIPT